VRTTVIDLRLGDCLDILPTLPDASVDCVVTDPPYPEIDRPYGRLTEAEWWELIVEGVIPQVRRVLKPTGSAVFVLQPNSRKVGSMRGWLFRFQAWACDHWNMVQDAWWWNHETLPKTKNDPNLLRPSLKACVWLGPADCYRLGAAVRWEESDANRARRLSDRCSDRLQTRGSRVIVRDLRARQACLAAGGVTAFNVLPLGVDAKDGKHQHPARTPSTICNWWLRYLCPEGGTALDPFVGSGTLLLEALKLGRNAIGVEKMPEYHAIAERRVRDAIAAQPLFAGA
jgi:DNA modification methylase